MFCPQCQAEYIEGIVTCADCHVDLVPELTDSHLHPSGAAEMEGKLLCSSNDAVEVGAIAQALSEAGLPHVIHEPPAVFRKPPVSIFVPEVHFDAACQILVGLELHNTHWLWGDAPACSCAAGSGTCGDACSDADHHFNQGLEAYDAHRFDEAEAHFQEALKRDPGSEDIVYNLALVYLEQKRFDQVRYAIAQIREIDTRDIQKALKKAEKRERR